MLNLIYCELLKLKRSKILIISIIGVMATPCMMLAETLQTHFENPELAVTLTNIYSDSLLYIMILINMIIYVTITSYLFSREYTENSIKTILPIPVSRMAFITGKFIVLYLWSVMLTLVTWMGILIFSGLYHAVIGMDGFLFTVIFEWLCKFLMGNTLLYLTITPFAFIAEKTKGMVAPMIASAVIVMGSAAILNHDIGALYPWTATCLIMEGRIQSTGYPDFLVSGIIVVVSVVGFLITFQHFKKEDIK